MAGLRQYAMESDPKGLDIAAVRQEVAEGLSAGDRLAAELLYTYYDIENLVSLDRGRSRITNEGNIPEDCLAAESTDPVHLPVSLGRVLMAFAHPDDPDYEDVDRSAGLERTLFEAYYRECAASDCRYLRQWGEFDRNLRNISAAMVARKLGRTPSDVVVGEGVVAEAVSRSSSADFGLKGLLDYMERIVAAFSDEVNFLERERRLDVLRWDFSEEITSSDYVNLDYILGYLTRLNIVWRWRRLDAGIGREMLRRLRGPLDGGAILEQINNQNINKI